MTLFDNRIFIHEDLSKLENRINVSLFGLLCWDPFRRWLNERLCLPGSTIIFPSRNVISTEGSIRPDFVGIDPQSGVSIVWIEVEIHQDGSQLERYRRSLAEDVVGIWGSACEEAILGLDDILGFVEMKSGSEAHSQVGANLEHLRELLIEALEGPNRILGKPKPVSTTMMKTPFVRDLCEILGNQMDCTPGVRLGPGGIRIQAIGDAGFSVRVCSPVSGSGDVGVLNQTSGRPFVNFPSLAWIRHYLPGKEDLLHKLAALVASMEGDMRDINYAQKTKVRLDVAKSYIPDLGEITIELAGGRLDL